MEILTRDISLAGQMVKLFDDNHHLIFQSDTQEITDRRKKALEVFKTLGFPTNKDEKWRNTDLKKALEAGYNYYFEQKKKKGIDLARIFQCNIPHLETDMISQLNGWFISENGGIKKHPDGVIVGSLEAAQKVYPDLINQHFGRYADNTKSGFVALNNAFAKDGVFIFVPDNVQVKMPIQIVNIIHHDQNIFVQNHNLVILGKNSSLQLVQCDDSVDHQRSLINTVTEVFIG